MPSAAAQRLSDRAGLPAPNRLRRLLRSVAVGLVLCLGVALFLRVAFGGSFGQFLIFSLCIGGSIQLLIESGRAVLVAGLRRRGRRNPALDRGWPGWWVMGPWVLCSALLGYALGYELAGWIIGLNLPPPYAGGGRGLAAVLAITVVVSVGATYHFYLQGRMATMAAQAEAARRLAGESQLRLLQAQLEPHMLFNTLANLRVLVTLDAGRAQTMLDHLIGYLRATLGASMADLHPLADEFARLDDYLALMALRMGPRLQVSLQLPAALRGLPVPPLLLQPLVENSIRHGLEPQVAGGRIEVRAALQGADLLLTVRDTGVGLAASAHAQTAAGPHYGSRLVAERLAALYGDRAGFRLIAADDAEGGALAELRLPLPAGAATAAAHQTP